MIEFDIRTVRTAFFDRAAIDAKVDAATRRALSKFGAFVRQRSRGMVRKSKKISQPGQPPRSHTGDFKRAIFFAYDAKRQSVVIGPVRFGSRPVPLLLERGGKTTRRRRDGAARSLFYRPRPLMRPAGDAEARSGKFNEILRGMVK